MDHRLIGGFLGTFVLILLGNGVVAAVLLAKSKAEGAGWVETARRDRLYRFWKKAVTRSFDWEEAN